MPGPPPKPNAVGHPRTKPALAPVTSEVSHLIPEPPDGILATTKESWVALWSSPLAKFYDLSTDGPIVRRYFWLSDERERMARAVKKDGRMLQGSRGQMVLNPMLREMGAMDAELRQLEDRLGLSPLSRMRLGIAVGEAARSLSDLNAALDADEDDDEEDIRVVSR